MHGDERAIRCRLPPFRGRRLGPVLLPPETARPSLQVPVPGPTGRTFWIDFGLDEEGAWGEFDGKGSLRHPSSALTPLNRREITRYCRVHPLEADPVGDLGSSG